MKNLFKLFFAVFIISASMATASVVEDVSDGVSQTEMQVPVAGIQMDSYNAIVDVPATSLSNQAVFSAVEHYSYVNYQPVYTTIEEVGWHSFDRNILKNTSNRNSNYIDTTTFYNSRTHALGNHLSNTNNSQHVNGRVLIPPLV